MPVEIKKSIKKQVFKTLGIKHWRTGKCKQCGQCCRTITFRFPDKLITRESEFEFLNTVFVKEASACFVGEIIVKKYFKVKDFSCFFVKFYTIC